MTAEEKNSLRGGELLRNKPYEYSSRWSYFICVGTDPLPVLQMAEVKMRDIFPIHGSWASMERIA